MESMTFTNFITCLYQGRKCQEKALPYLPYCQEHYDEKAKDGAKKSEELLTMRKRLEQRIERVMWKEFDDAVFQFPPGCEVVLKTDTSQLRHMVHKVVIHMGIVQIQLISPEDKRVCVLPSQIIQKHTVVADNDIGSEQYIPTPSSPGKRLREDDELSLEAPSPKRNTTVQRKKRWMGEIQDLFIRAYNQMQEEKEKPTGRKILDVMIKLARGRTVEGLSDLTTECVQSHLSHHQKKIAALEKDLVFIEHTIPIYSPSLGEYDSNEDQELFI